jgi:Flp pilus assembly pilin Flp
MRIQKDFPHQPAPTEYALIAVGLAVGILAILKTFGFW